MLAKPDTVAESRGESDVLLREERWWERTFNSVPDLIAILDCDHHVLQVNQALADRLGRTPAQCVGLACYEAIHGTTQPPAFCPHARTMIDGQAHAAEVREERLGGEFLVTTTPLCDEEGHAVGSVHVARDINEQKNAQDSLKHMLEVSEHERHLIGYELHDGLAQCLTAAQMQFGAFDWLKERNAEQAANAYAVGVRLVRDAHAEVRRLIERLRPPQLEKGGLIVALENLVREINEQKKIHIEFRRPLEQFDLEPMLEGTVFRIVQECLTNACRHSQSERVKVQVSQYAELLRVEVQDWGVGFDVDRMREGHFGLEGIHERAKVFGGFVSIKSQPGKGTDIVVELPVRIPSSPDQASEPSPTTLCPKSGKQNCGRLLK